MIKKDQYESSMAKLPTNVQVCARIRPLNSLSKVKVKETKSRLSYVSRTTPPSRRTPTVSSLTSTSRSDQEGQGNDTFVAWDISEDNTSASQSNKTEKIQGRTHSYTLDRVFGTDATTHQIYHKSVASLVQAAMEGYNSTVLAYGQTSTGKTHTMTGKRDEPGLIPLCVRDCFKYVREDTADEPREYLFRFSYLEIYKEHIRDLLSSTTSAPEPVRLFDGPNGLVIRGLKEEVVSSPDKVFHLLKQGDRRRQVGATHMNQHSSRSHVLVRLKIESSFASNKSGETRVSLLSLVDLAGSESVRLNGAERREEGQYINKSLMALGQVVLGLSESCKSNSQSRTSRSHIPYRDSKLTRLLQSSLSGNAQMLMMCCISPLASHLEESHNTFKFATRAKRIEQKASIQTAKDKEETLLQTYRNEIQDLKQQLAEATEQKQQLLEEQKAFQLIRHRDELTLGKIGVVATPINSSTTNGTKTTANNMESTTGEIEELVEAIQTMEQLILKSRPLHQQLSTNKSTPNSGGNIREKEMSPVRVTNNIELDEVLDRVLQSGDKCDEGDEDLLIDNELGNTLSRPRHKGNCSASEFIGLVPTSPSGYPRPTTESSIQNTTNTEDQLHSELTRIRGLLSTVLEKRGVTPTSRQFPIENGSLGHERVRKSLDFSTPSSNAHPSRYILDESLSEELEAGMNVDGIIDEIYVKNSKKNEERKTELESLRMQLEQQERTTSLRKADSHFLQLQLEEKDKFLEEVSSLLEALEQRQCELERENLALQQELSVLREEKGQFRECRESR